jgi:hypothetical protein
LRGSFITGLLMLAVSAVMAVVACGARTGLVPLPRDAGDSCSEPTTLQATIHACDGGQPTTISGTIYDPGAHDPLFNVVVYVPGTAVQPLPTGVSCDSCSGLYTGHPIVTALTDSTGRFVLQNAPDGDNIPLVVQVGKWRRQFTIAKVTPCTENALPDRTLTLPKNHLEGDIPNMAVSTGGADTLECLFTRIGLDAGEYGPGANGPGHIHIFQGSPQNPSLDLDASANPLCEAGVQRGTSKTVPSAGPSTPLSYEALWDSMSDIMRYDLVLLSCEGSDTAEMNQQVLFDYAQAGGRVFASHYHYAWFNTGPFSAAANIAEWTRGATAIEPLVCSNTGAIHGEVVTSLPNGQPFAGGQAMQDWLTTVGAVDADGFVSLANVRHNADLGPQNLATEWVAAGPDSVYGVEENNPNDPSHPLETAENAEGATLYMSFNTPIGAPPENQCGQVIFSDLHASASAGDQPDVTIPDGCANAALTADEKILEFMLFNLSSCVQSQGLPAPPPPCGMGTDGGTTGGGNGSPDAGL